MRILIFVLLSCIASLAHASEEEAMERFNYLMGDPERRTQAAVAGEERAVFCGYCHGDTGNSKRPHIPNLAGQNAIYLFHSFEKFASGKRIDFVMSQLAEKLTIEDRVNIAVYYSQHDVLPNTEGTNDALAEQGAALFKRTCVGCHGEQAEGRETMPRLAGQPAEYVRKALNRFRTNDPTRADSIMVGIAGKLNEHEINALADYLQKLSIKQI